MGSNRVQKQMSINSSTCSVRGKEERCDRQWLIKKVLPRLPGRKAGRYCAAQSRFSRSIKEKRNFPVQLLTFCCQSALEFARAESRASLSFLRAQPGFSKKGSWAVLKHSLISSEFSLTTTNEYVNFSESWAGRESTWNWFCKWSHAIRPFLEQTTVRESSWQNLRNEEFLFFYSIATCYQTTIMTVE